MKILITGAAGMLGSHLSELLLNKNYKVIGIDNLSVGKISSLSNCINNKNFSFYKFDVRKKKKLEKISKTCDAIIHLAAVKKVSESQSSFNTLDVNVNSTRYILDIAKKYKIKLIFASTSDVYGTSNKIPFNEKQDIVLGQSLAKRWSYAVSKLYCEHLCYCFYKDFKVDITILRYFGGFSEKSSVTWSGGHIPIFIKQLKNKEKIIIHGDGKQTRSMGHASDLAYGTYLALKSKKTNGKIINIGNDEELTVFNTLKLIAKELGINLKERKIKFVPEKKIFGNYKDIRRRKPDLSLAKKILGYKPKIKLKDAIRMVLNNIK
jgi:UDP-glucose 4-epimerase